MVIYPKPSRQQLQELKAFRNHEKIMLHKQRLKVEKDLELKRLKELKA